MLGPVLFTLYSQPLSDVISVHNCDYHVPQGTFLFSKSERRKKKKEEDEKEKEEEKSLLFFSVPQLLFLCHPYFK